MMIRRLTGDTVRSSSTLNQSVKLPVLGPIMISPSASGSSRGSRRRSLSKGSTIEILPTDHGLLIALQSGKVSLQAELDANYREIHPNCYAPACLSQVHPLPGGGSGTAVFHGQHPTLGSMVMKHGGPSDLQEVFSLSLISSELQQRGVTSETVQAAAERMKGRIPEFVMVYISPFHLRDRGKELWSQTVRRLSDGIFNVDDEESDSDDESEREQQPCNMGIRDEYEERKKYIRQIRLMEGSEVDMEVFFKYVNMLIPDFDEKERTIEDGHAFLASLLEVLVEEQQYNKWKFTVAQKTIGGATAENGATVLTSGKLKGELLERLIRDFIGVIHDLRKVTLPEETFGLTVVREELEELEKSKNVRAVSNTADAFVGSAIRKNFLPKTGRLYRLRTFGERFRMGTFILAESEETPALFLGAFLKRGVHLDSIFVDAPASLSALDCVMDGNYWLDLLEHATSFDHQSATDRIWTCGLTDAGLHNLFLCRNRGVEFFDLGEPQLATQPAFLTKFFMSFFHAAGMEENEEGTSWVRRFKVRRRKLDLTKETREMIPYIYDAFTFTMGHFIDELFEGDDSVRELLVKYVALQLLSDAAFCLERWEQKGGGKKRFGARACESLDKWLWRSLWDLFIASHVYQKLLIDGSASLMQQFNQSFTLR